MSFNESDGHSLKNKDQFEYDYNFRDSNYNQISIFPKKGSSFSREESNLYFQIYSLSGLENFAMIYFYGEKGAKNAK